MDTDYIIISLWNNNPVVWCGRRNCWHEVDLGNPDRSIHLAHKYSRRSYAERALRRLQRVTRSTEQDAGYCTVSDLWICGEFDATPFYFK